MRAALGNALDEETRRASQEIVTARENAVQQIAQEQRAFLDKMMADEKKAIWQEVLESTQSEYFDLKTTLESVGRAGPSAAAVNRGENEDRLATGSKSDTAAGEYAVTLEILPPRDQNEIAAIHTYLINMPEALKVELLTLVNKSIFKVTLRKPVNMTAKLGALPQVLSTEEVVVDGQKQIKIALLAKAKWEKDHDQMNEKMNKIFAKKIF